MERKQFLKLLGMGLVASSGILTYLKFFAAKVKKNTTAVYKSAIEKVVEIMDSFKKEGTNLVEVTLDGREYTRDPRAKHYPLKKKEVDKKNMSRMFFHAHRPNEYGHFHTFVDYKKGKYAHLIMISMNSNGEAVKLSTLNRWVTKERIADAEELKRGLDRFKMDPSLFPDRRIIDFVMYIFKAYKTQIYQLFDERDEAITNYKKEKGKEPWKDHSVEIWSSLEIDVRQDAQLTKLASL